MKIRPFASGAILRDVKFNQARYDSFIALQDKLHQNIARQRTLVAIGTHDLDTIKGPFTYDALPPQEIQFAPLNQTKVMDATEMMDFYQKDPHIGRYLHIIRDSPVYPVIYDANRVVCSMPPIINGNHSKISPSTRNIFIDVTATDRTKLEIVLNIIVTMFSRYCDEEFTVEPINIVSPHNNESRQVPFLDPRETVAEISYINSCCGLSLTAEEISKLLHRMCYNATPSKTTDLVDVSVPPTRADVLHQCDIMEDVAIAYGFNKLPRSVPSNSYTVAKPLKINTLTDILRETSASSNFTEVLPLVLASHEECFEHMNWEDDGNTAVRLANPKTAEYQIVRTSLIPGLLKTLRENKSHALPQKIFEVSDVTFKDSSRERKSKNERHFAAATISKTSELDSVHGLLDRAMQMLKCTFVTSADNLKLEDARTGPKKVDFYWMQESQSERDL